MIITKISDQHLKNRIGLFERMLYNKPDEQVYMGISDVAEEWVEQENRNNNLRAEEISSHIKYMKSELNQRSKSWKI